MVDANQWTIRSTSGEILFRGTKQECEDWLDWNENNDREEVELEAPGLGSGILSRKRPRRA